MHVGHIELVKNAGITGKSIATIAGSGDIENVDQTHGESKVEMPRLEQPRQG